MRYTHSLEYYNDFDIRQNAEKEQKNRLCEFAVDHFISENHFEYSEYKGSLFIGPGTTTSLFLKKLVVRLQLGCRDHKIKIISNNLDIFTFLEAQYKQGYQKVNLKLYGEVVDFKNQSLFPVYTGSFNSCFENINESLAVISCAGVFRTEDSFLIGAFNEEHSLVLKQVTESSFTHIYLIADDWKRAKNVDPIKLKRNYNNLNIFTKIAADSLSENLSLIIETDGNPSIYSGTEIITGLNKWWEKPQPSCFISYGFDYDKQVTTLYNDLQKQGIKCWKWDKNTFPADPVWNKIEEAIVTHKPLVLICGEKSLKSESVQNELKFAFQRGIQVIPIKIDEFLFSWKPTTRFQDLKTKLSNEFLIDGRDWDTDNQSYDNMLQNLLDTLRKSATQRKIEKGTKGSALDMEDGSRQFREHDT